VKPHILTTGKGKGRRHYPIFRCHHNQGGKAILNNGPVHPA
jgi:hypothetical protein